MMNIRKKLKQAVHQILVCLLCLVNLVPTTVSATSYITGSVDYDDWWIADPGTGRRDEHESKLQVNGEDVFCIDASTPFKDGVEMNLGSWQDVGISEAVAKDLALIAYFGTKVPGRTSKDWYAITQGLIWKVRHEADGYIDLCYIETPTNPDYATTVKYWNEILKDVEDYKKTPSFKNKRIELNAGETITLTDENQSLQNMIVKDDGGLDVSIKGNNQLVIKGNHTTNDTTTIILQRNVRTSETGTSLVYYNNVDQSLAKFKIKDPLQVVLNVKVNKFGELELTKTNAETGQAISDTEFRITGPNGFDETHTTDSNGKIKLIELPLGDYVAKETRAAHGYLINVTEYGFTIKPNETTELNVTNEEPKGKITLTKYNDDKSATLSDTTYLVTGPNGYNQTHKTNDKGQLVLENLKLGEYTLVEQVAKEGYLVNPTPITVSLTYKDQHTEIITGSAEQTNKEPTATIHLKKEDKETGTTAQGDATLDGAVYELIAGEDIYNKAHTKKFYSKGDVVATRITDKDGNMASVEGLPLGFYQLREVDSSDGYLVDSTIQNIHCDYEGQDVKVVVRSVKSLETVKKQAFQLIKVSTDESEETDLLAGAEFTVKLTSEVNQVGWDNARTYNVLSTDKKGYAKSIELPYGTYTVRETKVPDNVQPIPDFTVIINEDSREPQTWRAFNDAPFKALIKAVKVDQETGKTVLLPDTEFKIRNMETNEYVGHWVWFPIPHYVETFTTDKSGTVTTPDTLECGEYELVEIKAPYGYLLNDEPIRFTVSTNTAYQMAEDDKTPIITVTKEDVSVKGCISVLKIGEQLTDVKTDENGHLQFIYQKLLVNGAQFVVKASENIYSADNQKDLIFKKDEIVAELTTMNGEAQTDLLPLGKYKVYEVVASDGFVLNKEIKEVTLTYKDQETVIVTEDIEFENARQKVELEVIKLDSEEETSLSGAEFGLFTKEDIYGYEKLLPMSNDNEPLVKAGTLIETTVSDENGLVVFKSDLPLSLYEIKELKTPIGYVSNHEVYEIDATYQGQDVETIEVIYEVLNDITKVEISKQDLTTGKELPGAHMVVKEKDGSIFDSWISTNEPYLIKGLEPNKTYELIETSSPYGFALAQKIEFTVKDTGEVQKVEMKDDLVKGHLKWQKTGEAFTHTVTGQTEFGTTQSPVCEKQNLLNATITIYAAEDITLGNGLTYWHKDDAIEALSSDWGAVTSMDLLVGKYYYVESSDLHGYVTDTQRHYFEIKDNQSTDIQVVESTLENKRPSIDVKFTKYMETLKDHEELNAYQDVVFGIYAREDIYDYIGNVAIPYDTLISTTGIDELGQLYHFPELPNGLYYLKELQTNKMYNLDPTEYDFEIAWHGGDVSRYTINIGSDEGIMNELQRGKVIIHKTDLDTKEVLKDVEFVMSTDQDFNHIVNTVKTNEHGIAEFNELELGHYFIKENPVDSYVTNTHIYEVDITKDGDELTIEIENKPLEMEFSKVSITDNKELEGAKLQVIDKETGTIIDEWISTKETHKIKYLVEGKEYVMKEITAPKGYEIAESITFKAEDGVKITMKDKLIPEVPQTGDGASVEQWVILLSLAAIEILCAIYLKYKEDSIND